MTDTTRKMFGIYLDNDQDDRLNKIAEAMSRELGFPVSRSGAVGRLINAFALPAAPEFRKVSADTEQAAA